MHIKQILKQSQNHFYAIYIIYIMSWLLLVDLFSCRSKDDHFIFYLSLFAEALSHWLSHKFLKNKLFQIK